MNDQYSDILTRLDAENCLRQLPRPIGEDTINLSSNDYLGLQHEPQLWDEFCGQYQPSTQKMSACSSRLLTGNSNEHIQLEILLAKLYNKEAALIFNSGYHANVGILPALTSQRDLIVADKRIHASLIDGMQLCQAETLRFQHNDCNHLQRILSSKRHLFNRLFIVTESIFSMDGDVAPLKELIELKNRFNGFLYVDEAHAIGVRGNNGLGLLEEYDLMDQVEIVVATFGKAIASTGAFVACSNTIKAMLVNHCRSLIFSTALPPINSAWTHFVLTKMPQFNSRRENLQKLSQFVGKLTGQQPQSHIVPMVVGSNENAVELAQYLQNHQFYVLPIRHPTVPKGQARLRLSLTANLTISDLLPLKLLLNAYQMD